MKADAKLLLLIGIILLAAGLLFVGQGSGTIRWPTRSFMIDETRWIYLGGGIAIAGLVLIILSRK